MTNAEIIYTEVITHKIFTVEQATEILEKLGELPVHTFATWKAKGYAVKKGEKAVIQTRLWKMSNKKKKDEEEKDEEEKRKFYLTKAFLFTFEQVEKIKK